MLFSVPLISFTWRIMLVITLGDLFCPVAVFSNEEPAQALPVFKVRPGNFDCTYVIKKGAITSVKITEVPANTATHRAGLRKGDHIVAIDGIKVIGLPRDDFERLFAPKKEIGATQRFTFLKSKGLIVRLNKTFDITYTVTGKLNPEAPVNE